MKNGDYVNKRISLYSILCAVISLLFICFMYYLWMDAAKDRGNYKQYYEYFQEQAREQKENKQTPTLRVTGATGHEEPRLFFILSRGVKSGDGVTHAILDGSIVSKSTGWNTFYRLALAKEELNSERIQRRMREPSIEVGIAPLI